MKKEYHLHVDNICEELSQVKKIRALNETPSQSYRVSLAIWDHTVLPATQHK